MFFYIRRVTDDEVLKFFLLFERLYTTIFRL